MSLSSEELRSILIEYLGLFKKNDRRQQLQFMQITSGVDHLLAKRLDREADAQRGQHVLNSDDKERLQNVVWDLILSRVLIPGTRDPSYNSGWPFITITDHGWDVIAAAGPVPYDPDGYLSALNSRASGLHSTIIRYIEESLATFRTSAYLASVVMLGAASEKLLSELCDSIAASIATPVTAQKFKQKINSKKMKERLDTVVGWCRNHRTQLSPSWQNDEQIEVLEQLGHFIRKRRNDAGHPQDPPAVPRHEEMYAWLVVFPDYCESVWSLKLYLDGMTGKIT